jgi:hypothetical protein
MNFAIKDAIPLRSGVMQILCLVLITVGGGVPMCASAHFPVVWLCYHKDDCNSRRKPGRNS